MSDLAEGEFSAPPRAQTGAGAAPFPLSAAILLALASAAALTLGRAQSVWFTGAFFDSDDAMRAVQLRDLLAGQGWFDMTAHRVDPPGGLFMHWSRIVDAPLAALDLLFGMFLSPDRAERATRLAFPLLMLAALYGAAARLAAILADRAARIPAVVLTLLSGAVFLQFAPGRIDHHAPQIVLLALSAGFFLRGLSHAASMAAAAAAMAVSFAVSLENVPFFAVTIAALPALFVLDGEKSRRQLLWFAASVVTMFPLLYAATIGRERYFLSACDAYSAVHLVAALTGAISLAALGAAAPLLATRRARLYAVGGAGFAVLAAVLLLAPKCLGDPLGGLDPLLRDIWLSHVVEAKPLWAVAAGSPGIALATALPVALGLAAALIFGLANDGVSRRRWLVLAAALAAGLAAGCWQVRVFTSVTPLAMAALAAAVTRLAGRAAGSMIPLARAALIGALCLAVSPIGMALAHALAAPDEDETQGSDLSCMKPEILAPLNDLPPARIAAPVDMGAHLLAHTPHSVFAAPYHRDNHGARIAVDAFLAPPAQAEKILRAAGAGLVLWCQNPKKPNALVQRAPDGLAAALARGETPAWLEPKSAKGSPLLVFAFRPE